MPGLVSSVRRALFRKLFDLNTRSGRRFEGMCALFALLSVIVIFIESGVGTQYHLTFEEWRVFVWLEIFITLVFTLDELCFRLAGDACPARPAYSQAVALYAFSTGVLECVKKCPTSADVVLFLYRHSDGGFWCDDVSD